jgi:hypothetical protein
MEFWLHIRTCKVFLQMNHLILPHSHSQHDLLYVHFLLVCMCQMQFHAHFEELLLINPNPRKQDTRNLFSSSTLQSVVVKQGSAE